jgi:hypothetical protein
MIAERVAQGPRGYTTFGPAMQCGRMLNNAVNAAEKYLADVSDEAEQLAQLIKNTRDLLKRHAFEYRGDVAYNDFTEMELEDFCSAASRILEALGEADTPTGPSEDAPVRFDPAEMASQLEVLASTEDFAQASGYVATLVLRVKSMTADQRLAPITSREADLTLVEWLSEYIGDVGARNGRISVLDLSLIPADVLHLVIAVVARLIFEALQRYRRLEGQELPTVIVLEEAHSFIQRQLGEEPTYATPAKMCRETFERIAREGRKFGLGLVAAPIGVVADRAGPV